MTVGREINLPCTSFAYCLICFADPQSHDPLMFRVTGSKVLQPEDEHETIAPKNLPVLNDRAKQLAGITAY